MCQFFSFVTDPVNHPAEYYFLDWEYRKENLKADDADIHSHVCSHFRLNEDKCNKYEFNPLTKKFAIDKDGSTGASYEVVVETYRTLSKAEEVNA